MTRRQSLRNATLLAVGMALGKMDMLKAQGGELRCRWISGTTWYSNCMGRR